MKRLPGGRIGLSVLLWLALPQPCTLVAQELPSRTVGVVIDGPGAINEAFSGRLQEETRALLRLDYDVRFPPDRTLVGDWSVATTDAHLDRLLSDPGVDVVLAMGVIASTVAARRETLPKPVIAPFTLDAELDRLPEETLTTVDGRQIRVSGRDNLSYLEPAWNFRRDLGRFRELVEFDDLAVFVDGGLADALPEIGERLREVATSHGVTAHVIAVRDGGTPLQELDPDVDAAMIGVLLNLQPPTIQGLVDGLVARSLPSFSLLGRPDVERGVLFGLAPDSNVPRLARRVAIHVQHILLGGEPTELSIDLRHPTRLTMNRATARAVGYSPSWDVLTEAEVLHDRDRRVTRSWTLAESVQEALRVNLDLRAARRAVRVGEEELRQARSRLLPQIDAGLTGVWIDSDRAEASLGSQAGRSLRADLGVTQLILSDAARTGVDTGREALEALRAEERQVSLEIVRDTALAYLDVMRAEIGERVQRQNLEVIRANLELAQARYDAGTAGPSEVARWEAEIATGRRALVDATARRNQTEIQLNRLLDRDLEESFDVVEEGLFGADGEAVTPEIEEYVDDQAGFRILREFFAREALLGSPELQVIDAALAAQRRVLLAARRSFWWPTVALQGTLTRRLVEAGAGTGTAPPIPGFAFPTPDDTDWSIAVDASLPLYRGGFRFAERDRAREALEQLQRQRAALADRIEQRVRSRLHAAGASWAAIDFTRQASEAAARNLEIVQEAYSVGLAQVIDLIDATNAALIADLAAATARFDYLADILEVERAAGRFHLFGPGIDKAEWLRRLREFYDSHPEGTP